jgi:hypothetical protein
MFSTNRSIRSYMFRPVQWLPRRCAEGYRGLTTLVITPSLTPLYNITSSYCSSGHRYFLHVPLLEAISFGNYVPIAAAPNAIRTSQDLYVVESEDACHDWGCRLPTSNCSLFTINSFLVLHCCSWQYSWNSVPRLRLVINSICCRTDWHKTCSVICILYLPYSVVRVLCYKSEGRWFDSRWCRNFSLI